MMLVIFKSKLKECINISAKEILTLVPQNRIYPLEKKL